MKIVDIKYLVYWLRIENAIAKNKERLKTC